MTSQPGLQTIAIHILPNISQNKGNQIMKSGQLTEYNKRNIFFQKFCKNLVPDPLYIFKKLKGRSETILATESSLKMTKKNAFYSTLKALVVLKIFNFLS